MDWNTVTFVVLLGLCILPSCFLQLYHIKDAKNWTEAQSYCREKYSDLVTINSEEDMVRLSHMLWDDGDEVWIGLYGDFNNWRWSLEREGFYEEGQAEFRWWHGGQPDVYRGLFICANIAPWGVWSDYWCDTEHPFVCYNEFSETRYIYVKAKKSWTSAQSYCRRHYTDLASVRNGEESKEISKLVDTYAWIGLYRESWKWSDGQRLRMTSFGVWNLGQPDKIQRSCVTTTHSKWNARLCQDKYTFVCTAQRKQVVKVMLKNSDSSVDLEDMQDAILHQFNQRLKDHPGEPVRLKWIKQPDGKIFHLKETEDKKEKENDKSCILKS